MFEQNNVGVRLQNPVLLYLLSAQYMTTVSPEIYTATIDHVLESTHKIISVIEGTRLDYRIYLNAARGTKLSYNW